MVNACKHSICRGLLEDPFLKIIHYYSLKSKELKDFEFLRLHENVIK